MSRGAPLFVVFQFGRTVLLLRGFVSGLQWGTPLFGYTSPSGGAFNHGLGSLVKSAPISRLMRGQVEANAVLHTNRHVTYDLS